MLESNTSLRIEAIFDYIVKIKGKYSYKQNQIFQLKRDKNIKFFLISATIDSAYLITDKNDAELIIGDELIESKEDFLISTKENYFGKIIDIYGNIIWPQNSLKETNIKSLAAKNPIFGNVHDLMTVKPLNEQLHTGIISIDLLIPIGKGQRELIIGDRQTGKTHIAINAIINQAKNNTKCICVAIGQKSETLTAIYETLAKYNVLQNTIIIDAPSRSAYEQYLAPYVAMAHAENISYSDDCLIVFDDLTKHANIFREIALLIDKPVGKEAMPGNMFYAHSSLLERAGSFVNRKTITALPILQTIDGDITSLISSNVISITDGQIVTSADLFASGKLPAINIDLSVSRLGSSVQSQDTTKIAKEIGKIFKKYKYQMKLAMLDYELNKETSTLFRKGKLIDKMFLQRGFSLYSYNFVIFMTKIISWDLLKGIKLKDEQKVLNLLNILINSNEQAKTIFHNVRNGIKIDEELARDYFSFCLQQYSNYFNLGWQLDYKHDFMDLDQSEIIEIAKKVGDL